MGRERFPKQSLGALYGRIKQVGLLGVTLTRDPPSLLHTN